MDVVAALEDVRARARQARGGGSRIGLVPTMGALHEGHLALVARARAVTDVVVLSVFVNPLQFGPSEDFERYPRDLDGDASLARSTGVDLLWAPSTADMYPAPPQVTVSPGPGGERYEGAARPGHFTGVLTVVLKLLMAVEPHVAVFGRKDFQQVVLIRRMVRDFNLPVEVLVAPTVRERDGLALSSRNLLLEPARRHEALALARALRRGVERYRAGERRAAAIEAVARAVLDGARDVATDYVACIAGESLEAATTVTGDTVLAVAARVGPVRLIDNVALGEGLEADPHVGG
jgi:pantoate--beta-alanine ligase